MRPRRSGGKRPYWAGNFELSENPAAPDTIRILRGAYNQSTVDEDGNLQQVTLPYVYTREHYHGPLSKGALCSAGPYYMDRNKREPCHGCDIFWEDYEVREQKKLAGDNSKGPDRIGMSDKFAFSVWDYGIYFQMPQVGRDGQYRMNPKTNQPYTTWVKAANPQDPQFAGYPWKQGSLLPWSVYSTWKDLLVSFDHTVGMCCMSCCGRNTMVSRGWYCGNPQCRQFVFDQNNTTISQEQQQQLTKNKQRCNHCGQITFLHEDAACTQCGGTQRASIFDVDLTAYRLRTGRGNQSTLVIAAFSDPRPIQVADAETLAKIKPLDLLKRFAPTSLEEQAKLWRIGEPAAAAAPAGGYQPPPVGGPQQGFYPVVQHQPPAPAPALEQALMPQPQSASAADQLAALLRTK